MERSPHRLAASLPMSGDFRVHRAGCRDLKRESQNSFLLPDEIRTSEAAAQELYSDFIDEGSMEPGDAEGYVEFLPCCEFQRVEESSKKSGEAVDADANSTYTGVVGQEQDTTEGVTMNAATATQTLVEYTAELQNQKTTDLRKVARRAGLKVVADTPVNKGRKADLVAALVELKGQELDALVEQAKAAKAPKAKKTKAAKKDEQAALGTSAADDNAVKIRTARKFVAEADAKGWEVKIDNQMATEQGDVVIIVAEKGEESITLRWIDGAYDYYQGGSFHTDAKGKARKILNVSAAINRYL